MDIANFPDIKINYQADGSITKQEADRLFEIVYNRFADKVNNYLDSKNIKLDQYSYAAAVDLVYNRGLNDLTKEVFSLILGRVKIEEECCWFNKYLNDHVTGCL